MSFKISSICKCALIGCVFVATQPAGAALVYWQNFEGANGVEDSGNPGVGGTLTPKNTTVTTTSFDAAGGIFGGTYNATNNDQQSGDTGRASTESPGTPLNLGSLSQFTVTLWLNTHSFRTSTSGGFREGRVLVVGDSAVTDRLQANSFAITQQPGAGSAGVVAAAATKFGVTFGTTTINSAVGAANTAGQWTFVAVTYDGTTAGQFYRGTDTTAVLSSALTMPAGASLNIGTSGNLYLMSNPLTFRSVKGWIDDVRIYDGALSPADVEQVRQDGLIGVPEPCSIFLTGIGVLGLALIIKKLPIAF